MIRVILKKSFLFISLGSLTFSAWANTAIENQYLQQIQNQLQTLGPLLDAAQVQADPNARVQFQYGKFRADLKIMEQGLETQIKKSNLQPRSIIPLQGDYSEVP